MEWLLNFFSDLILFTAGIAVAGLWVVLLVLVAIEAYDMVKDALKEDV
jgi:hypothetical protein